MAAVATDASDQAALGRGIMPGIIVGVDGSGHSEAALGWAIDETAIRDAPLAVIAVVEHGADFWAGNQSRGARRIILPH